MQDTVDITRRFLFYDMLSILAHYIFFGISYFKQFQNLIFHPLYSSCVLRHSWADYLTDDGTEKEIFLVIRNIIEYFQNHFIALAINFSNNSD